MQSGVGFDHARPEGVAQQLCLAHPERLEPGAGAHTGSRDVELGLWGDDRFLGA